MKESYVKMLGMGIGSELMKINTSSIKAVKVFSRVNSIVSICSCYEKQAEEKGLCYFAE